MPSTKGTSPYNPPSQYHLFPGWDLNKLGVVHHPRRLNGIGIISVAPRQLDLTVACRIPFPNVTSLTEKAPSANVSSPCSHVPRFYSILPLLLPSHHPLPYAISHHSSHLAILSP